MVLGLDRVDRRRRDRLEFDRLGAPIALWVLPVGALGGVGRHAVDVARVGLPGWRTVFLAPPGPVVAALRAEGAAVLEADFGPDHGFRTSLATLRHTTSTLRPRVVHSHLAYADLVVAAGVWEESTRLVSTEHGIADDDSVYHGSTARARAMATAHRLRTRRFDALIAVSESTARVMRKKWHPTSPVRVIRNGVDPVTHGSRRGLEILSLARLAPEKGLPELLQAFAVLAAAEPSATLTIAGIGPLESALKAQAEALGLADRITLPGFVDPQEAMSRATVLAMLSAWENASYALLDAVAHGLGVVATPVGGNPEILPERCLVDGRDPNATATALRQQGLDLELRPGLADWPTVADMAAATAQVYDQVVGP